MKTCYQVNWQTSFGGGEVYTRFACAALARLGWRTVLFAHRDAGFWDSLDMHGAELVRISTIAEIDAGLPERDALVLSHNVLDERTATDWGARHRLAGILHMPLFERDPPGLAHYGRLFAVSQHVLDSARQRGLRNVYSEPLLGVADLAPRGPVGPLRRGPLYDWDRKKMRDRLMGTATAVAGVRRGPEFARLPGVTLGIVSRITPIKQFPLLFSILAPILADLAGLRLEVFGSGGYASVRDLRRELRPIRERVRFWGSQSDVAAVYRQLDYALSGLPEKEALGLNLIEAQACGTPVLAVRAAPFTETVIDGNTGYLYCDPREDGGAEFRALVTRILGGAPPPDPRLAREHLERFSLTSFSARLERALASLEAAG
ncbi:MAG: glycosyltransferase family 4 protein [Betaproteobacteria bacterium]|nr:glycosyltransferase family 4 protein [Betaproteobacteria bacterium]